jgi:hypothetical protein
MSGRDDVDRTELQLQAAALTLLSVILSIGVTVAFGVTGPWWLRTAVGTAVSVGLVAIVAFAARHTPLLRRLARWATGQ